MKPRWPLLCLLACAALAVTSVDRPLPTPPAHAESALAAVAAPVPRPAGFASRAVRGLRAFASLLAPARHA